MSYLTFINAKLAEFNLKVGDSVYYKPNGLGNSPPVLCRVIGYNSTIIGRSLPIVRPMDNNAKLPLDTSLDSNFQNCHLSIGYSSLAQDRTIFKDEIVTWQEFEAAPVATKHITYGERGVLKDDKDIEANLTKFGFKLGQEVEVAVIGNGESYGSIKWLGNHTSLPAKTEMVTVIGATNDRVIISYRNGWDSKPSDKNPIHSSFKDPLTAWSCEPSSLLTKEKKEKLTTKELAENLPKWKFAINGESFTEGEELWGVILFNKSGSRDFFIHNDYHYYDNYLKTDTDVQTEMVPIKILGPSKDSNHIRVMCEGIEYTTDANAICRDKIKPIELRAIEHRRLLYKAGFQIDNQVNIVTANFDNARHRLLGESMEEYAKYVLEKGGIIRWQSAQITGVDSSDPSFVMVKYTDLEGNLNNDRLPLAAVSKLNAFPPEPWKTILVNQELAKFGFKIGDKVKFLRARRQINEIVFESNWHNTDFTAYAKRTESPVWVEGIISGTKDNSILVNIDHTIDGSFDPGSVFPLSAELPPEVLAAFPPPKPKAKIKVEVISAAYRVASMQLTALARRSIITMLRKTDNARAEALSKILDTEMGRAVIGGTIGLMLLRFYPTDTRAIRLAEEFRINAMAVVGNEVIDGLMGEIIPGLVAAFSSLPKEEKTRLMTETSEEIGEIVTEIEKEVSLKEKTA